MRVVSGRPTARAVAAAFSLVLLLTIAAVASAAPSIVYRISIPRPRTRSLQVEATFSQLPNEPLVLRFSRTSPGRYALHEFVMNVFDVRITDGAGRRLAAHQTAAHAWEVPQHDGTVRVSYRVFGDRVDGTWLAVDATHAHINMPATLIWARGLEGRPATVRFEPPRGSDWRVATQLFPTPDPLVFTAPNLQYLMDSPAEVGRFEVRHFVVPSGEPGRDEIIRVVIHHEGTDAEADAYVRDVERIVHEQRAMMGELPVFEPGSYLVLADYLPWANGDGMEHRNSTVLTSHNTLRTSRVPLLSTVAHEFFHVWNVERIRPASLEPFDFERDNTSGELWLAEGFTSYAESLTMVRTGLKGISETLTTWTNAVSALAIGADTRHRSTVEMSLLAPLVDGGGRSDVPTVLDSTYVSYYVGGAALGLALDLSLRVETRGVKGFDDFMRDLWVHHGRAGEAPAGLVARPYTIADARAALARVSANPGFADAFFDRYIEGRQVPDFERLLAQAGFELRRAAPDRPWIGLPRTSPGNDGLTLEEPPRLGTPLDRVGLGRGDAIVALDGERIDSEDDLDRVLSRLRPGQMVPIRFRSRGEDGDGRIHIEADPRLEIVELETSGRLTPEQAAFRKSWLSSRVAREQTVARWPQ